MRYGALWSKFSPTKIEVLNYLKKYGHLLKWKDYKEDILEVGCAGGSITREVLYPHVKNHLRKLVAIDKSEGMINFSKTQNTIDNLDFRAMDIMDKKKSQEMANQFDHIFSFYCAHWIIDQRSFIDGLYKLLKPQGQIFMTIFLDSGVKQSFLKQYSEGKWFKYLPKEQIFPEYTDNPVQYITNIVKDSGLKMEVCESEKKSAPVDDFADTVRAIVSIYKYLDLLSPELKEEYFQEHIKNSKEFSTYLGPDKYDLPYETMICICSKNM